MDAIFCISGFSEGICGIICNLQATYSLYPLSAMRALQGGIKCKNVKWGIN